MSLLCVPALAAESEISLQVNGQTVSLNGVVPEVKNGRTFIPVRAAFEALGAEVEWDQATKTVLADKGGKHVEMQLDSTTAIVTGDDGTRATLTMDAAPYAKNGRTYVPVRFAAEALDCAVGYDSTTRTVIIVDVDALMEGMTFTRMNGWLDNYLESIPDGNNAVVGSAILDLVAVGSTGATASIPGAMKIDFTKYASDYAHQIEIDLDFRTLAAVLGKNNGMSDEELQQLSSLATGVIDTRLNLVTGEMYSNVDSLGMMFMTEGSVGNSDKWYLLDLDEAMKRRGLGEFNEKAMIEALEKALDSGDGIGLILHNFMLNIEPSHSDQAYEKMKELSDMFRYLLSDEHMTQNGNKYSVAWSKDVNPNGTDIKFTYEVKNGSLVGLTGSIVGKTDHATPYSVDIDLTHDGMNTKGTIVADSSGITATLNINIDRSSTTKTPSLQLPGGVEIVDMLDFLGDTTLTEFIQGILGI
jgi:hypothetical protein